MLTSKKCKRHLFYYRVPLRPGGFGLLALLSYSSDYVLGYSIYSAAWTWGVVLLRWFTSSTESSESLLAFIEEHIILFLCACWHNNKTSFV